MSASLQPHGLHHTRLPCPSPTPKACSNSCLLSWWCLWHHRLLKVNSENQKTTLANYEETSLIQRQRKLRTGQGHNSHKGWTLKKGRHTTIALSIITALDPQLGQTEILEFIKKIHGRIPHIFKHLTSLLTMNLLIKSKHSKKRENYIQNFPL